MTTTSKVEVREEATLSVEPKAPDEPPFGGGELVGLLVNPTSKEVQGLQGIDKYGFSFNRSYGGSTFQPLVRHCGELIASNAAVERMVGYAHLNDRFMVVTDVSPELSQAEQGMYKAAHVVGQQLLDKGALAPIVFPRVEVIGHRGPEVLEGHYIPSCGFDTNRILDEFLRLMASPDAWLWNTAVHMAKLFIRIEKGLAAPVPGYEESK